MDTMILADLAMLVTCYLGGLSLNLGYIHRYCIIPSGQCIDSKLQERELISRLSKILTFNRL